MRNVTIVLEDEIARKARVWAAEHDTSVSRMVGEMLAEKMRTESDYQAAMTRFLDRKVTFSSQPGEKYPTREEIYDRKVLR